MDAKPEETITPITVGQGSQVPGDTMLLARFCRDVDDAITTAMNERDERFCVNWADLNCVDASLSFHMPGSLVANKPVLTAFIEEGDCHLFEKWIKDRLQPKYPDFHVDVKTEW